MSWYSIDISLQVFADSEDEALSRAMTAASAVSDQQNVKVWLNVQQDGDAAVGCTVSPNQTPQPQE